MLTLTASPLRSDSKRSPQGASSHKPVIRTRPPPISHFLPLLRILFGRGEPLAKVASERPQRSEKGRVSLRRFFCPA
jgi:hypothetical protein